MVYTFAEMHRRNHRSWPAIVGRLSNPGALNEGSAPRRRWNIFSDAGVLMEMADYAERNAHHSDVASLAVIRINAAQLRLDVLRSLMTCSRMR